MEEAWTSETSVSYPKTSTLVFTDAKTPNFLLTMYSCLGHKTKKSYPIQERLVDDKHNVSF